MEVRTKRKDSEADEGCEGGCIPFMLMLSPK